MMTPDKIDTTSINEAIRDIPDFPKEGILFKDITPVLKDPKTFKQVADVLHDHLVDLNIDYIVGIESRGFIFSPVLAYRLDAGFVPVRKKGKLPYKTQEVAYDLEYGQAILEIHEDAIEKGSRIAIVDDLLATGGTALAAAQLVEKLGGEVASMSFLVELDFLKGREKLGPYNVFSILHY